MLGLVEVELAVLQPQLVQNVRAILASLQCRYEAHTWLIRDLYFDGYDEDCVAMQWADTSLCVFVWPRAVSIETLSVAHYDEGERYTHIAEELVCQEGVRADEFANTFARVIEQL